MSYPKLTADDVATLTAFFAWVDTNADGFISVAEIKQAMQVDTNADGTISPSEVDTSALPWLNDFVAQDLDQDAQISLAELLAHNNSLKA